MSNADSRGKFVWHELLTADAASAKAFYPKVVAWKSQPWEHDPSYTVLLGKNGPVGGVMALSGAAGAPRWMPYIGVEDVHATVAQAKSLGAKVTKDVTEMPNVGRYAVLTDPQGAEFAVHQSSQPQPGAPKPASGDFGWHELATSDADAAMRFYTHLFGWGVGPKHDMGGPVGFYHLFLHGGEQYGGVFKSPSGDPPAWLCYVHVDDAGKAVSAAKAAGGRVMNGPMEVPGGSWIAQMMDPEGAAFAVMEAPKAAAAAEPAAQAASQSKPKAPKVPKPAAASAAPSAAETSAKPAAAPKAPAAPKPAPAAAAAPSSAPAPKAAAKPAAAKPAAVAKPAGAPKKTARAAKPAAKKAPAKKTAARKSAKKTAVKAAAKKAKSKGKSAAKKAAGKSKAAAKRAPAKRAKKKAGKRAAGKSAARRAKPKKHR